MYYVYLHHLHDIAYIMDEYLEYHETYCEQCGDSDMLLAECETYNEALEYKIHYNKGKWN